VYPQGRGSCTTSGILLELIRTGRAPAAIVNLTVEPVLAVGPLVGEVLYGRTLPLVTLSPEAFARIRTGDWLVVDAIGGEVLCRQLPADTLGSGDGENATKPGAGP
jgi:predicted aconitase with swiveling domain